MQFCWFMMYCESLCFGYATPVMLAKSAKDFL